MGEQIGIERAVGNMTIMPSRRSDTPGMPGMSMPAAMPSQGGMHGGHGSMGRDKEQARAGLPTGDDGHAHGDAGRAAQKLTAKRETRGMRRDWYTGLQGLMTAVRVLPPDLYDRVMSGEGDVAPGQVFRAETQAKPCPTTIATETATVGARAHDIGR